MSINNIPDAIQHIVTSMQDDGYDIQFQFGHPKEIQQTLIEWSRDPSRKEVKTPLLILFLDFEEDKYGEDKTYITVADVTIIIANETNRNYKAQERLENVFKPVLWPLYEAFIEECELSVLFDVDAKFHIPHKKTDHYFYAADEAKDQNVFAAYWDAIEITNLELKLQEQDCSFTSNNLTF